jgi:glycosyltransferase involved in cell wall biosynthesis
MPCVSEQLSNANPKVSVAMITYNHGGFIAQAIESVLMQETDFPVELVIGEDCSTDNTRRIVREYAERYPNVIHALLPEHNLGMYPNSVAVVNACRGRYIAFLEGDDFWIGTQKLQKQADFIDTHSEASLCFHNVYCCVEHDGAYLLDRLMFDNVRPKTLGISDILGHAIVPTGSVMIRRSALTFPSEAFESPGPDRFMQAGAALAGALVYMDEDWGAYRVHSGGVYSSLDRVKVMQNRLKNLELLHSFLEYRYVKDVRRARSFAHYQIALCRDRSTVHLALRHALKCLFTWPKHPDVNLFEIVKAVFWHISPALYSGSQWIKRFVK